jgi:cytochrome c-type protein NapC
MSGRFTPHAGPASNRGNGLLGTMLMGTMIGAVGWVGFDRFVAYTSTTEFCLSCHEMKVMQEELSGTAHFKNRSGVGVVCGDCHVPREQPERLIAKFSALDDIYGHLLGVIDTPEKFEMRRMDMAERVWASLRATGSRECRACHSFESMEFDKQSDRPRRKHGEAMKNGETCIDCHKGVAHRLPNGFRGDDH